MKPFCILGTTQFKNVGCFYLYNISEKYQSFYIFSVSKAKLSAISLQHCLHDNQLLLLSLSRETYSKDQLSKMTEFFWYQNSPYITSLKASHEAGGNYVFLNFLQILKNYFLPGLRLTGMKKPIKLTSVLTVWLLNCKNSSSCFTNAFWRFRTFFNSTYNMIDYNSKKQDFIHAMPGVFWVPFLISENLYIFLWGTKTKRFLNLLSKFTLTQNTNIQEDITLKVPCLLWQKNKTKKKQKQKTKKK